MRRSQLNYLSFMQELPEGIEVLEVRYKVVCKKKNKLIEIKDILKKEALSKNLDIFFIEQDVCIDRDFMIVTIPTIAKF